MLPFKSMLKNQKVKKRIVISSAAVALLAIVGGLFLRGNDTKNPPQTNPTNNTTSQPSNQEDQPRADVGSDKFNSPDSGTTSTGSNKKQVTPVLSVSQESPGADVEANGYVPSIVEIDGKCTFTLTMGSITRSETGNAFNDAQSTTCGLLTIARSSLSAGTWKATLSYTSSKSYGSSDPVDIDVK